MSVLSLLKKDLQQCIGLSKNPGILAVFKQIIIDAGFRGVFFYRLGHFFRKKRMRVLAILCEKFMHHLCNCWISTNAEIDEGFVIRHVGCIIIGGLVRIGKNCDIRQGITLGGNMGKVNAEGYSQPHLGDNILIGAGAQILGPIYIGNNCVIGANAVVVNSIEDNCIAGGVPARILKKRA